MTGSTINRLVQVGSTVNYGLQYTRYNTGTRTLQQKFGKWWLVKILGAMVKWVVSITVVSNIRYCNGKVHSLYSWTLQKIPITSKKVSNKNCLELNFQQKAQWMYISILPRSGTMGEGGVQRLPCLKYYNLLKRESRFTLRLNHHLL